MGFRLLLNQMQLIGCRHDFHNGFMAYIFQFGESTTHIFVTWVVLMKEIFSCLNLKPDHGFLAGVLHEVFLDKTAVHISTVC